MRRVREPGLQTVLGRVRVHGPLAARCSPLTTQGRGGLATWIADPAPYASTAPGRPASTTNERRVTTRPLGWVTSSTAT